MNLREKIEEKIEEVIEAIEAKKAEVVAMVINENCWNNPGILKNCEALNSLFNTLDSLQELSGEKTSASYLYEDNDHYLYSDN